MPPIIIMTAHLDRGCGQPAGLSGCKVPRRPSAQHLQEGARERATQHPKPSVTTTSTATKLGRRRQQISIRECVQSRRRRHTPGARKRAAAGRGGAGASPDDEAPGCCRPTQSVGRGWFRVHMLLARDTHQEGRGGKRRRPEPLRCCQERSPPAPTTSPGVAGKALQLLSCTREGPPLLGLAREKGT